MMTMFDAAALSLFFVVITVIAGIFIRSPIGEKLQRKLGFGDEPEWM